MPAISTRFAQACLAGDRDRFSFLAVGLVLLNGPAEVPLTQTFAVMKRCGLAPR